MKSHFMVGIALLLMASGQIEAKEVKGFDCWSLGMTPDQVRACEQRGPYVEVKATGGIETANGAFQGRKTNVSFVFEDNHLVKIQLWLCESADLDTAVTATTRAWKYLVDEFGEVALAGNALPRDMGTSKFEIQARSYAEALPADKQDKFQLSPVSAITGASVWASVFRHPQYGYYAFLYFAKP